MAPFSQGVHTATGAQPWSSDIPGGNEEGVSTTLDCDPIHDVMCATTQQGVAHQDLERACCLSNATEISVSREAVTRFSPAVTWTPHAYLLHAAALRCTMRTGFCMCALLCSTHAALASKRCSGHEGMAAYQGTLRGFTASVLAAATVLPHFWHQSMGEASLLPALLDPPTHDAEDQEVLAA